MYKRFGYPNIQNTSLALCISTQEIISWEFKKGTYDSFSFIAFIEFTIGFLQTCIDVPRNRIILIIDNCPSHTSYFSRDRLKELGIRIHFNAPNSPELNFIENLFGYLIFQDHMPFLVRRFGDLASFRQLFLVYQMDPAPALGRVLVRVDEERALSAPLQHLAAQQIVEQGLIIVFFGRTKNRMFFCIPNLVWLKRYRYSKDMNVNRQLLFN